MQKEIEKQDFGAVLPDFTLIDLNGKLWSLSQRLEGKKGAVVIFWSSTCSHCVRYDEVFNSFTARHPELAFLVVASRIGETPDEVKKAAAERHLAFSVILDPGATIARHNQKSQFRMTGRKRIEDLVVTDAVGAGAGPEDNHGTPLPDRKSVV